MIKGYYLCRGCRKIRNMFIHGLVGHGTKRGFKKYCDDCTIKKFRKEGEK